MCMQTALIRHLQYAAENLVPKGASARLSPHMSRPKIDTRSRLRPDLAALLSLAVAGIASRSSH